MTWPARGPNVSTRPDRIPVSDDPTREAPYEGDPYEVNS